MHLEVEVLMLMIALLRYVWVLIRHPYILTDLQAVLRPRLAYCTASHDQGQVCVEYLYVKPRYFVEKTPFGGKICVW